MMPGKKQTIIGKIVRLFGFYDISTFVGYLMLKYIFIQITNYTSNNLV